VASSRDSQVVANHYNPDLMTAPADISINGAPTFHVNFANTFSWNQFWNRTIAVRLRAGAKHHPVHRQSAVQLRQHHDQGHLLRQRRR
jgi:hypothetical protein